MPVPAAVLLLPRFPRREVCCRSVQYRFLPLSEPVHPVFLHPRYLLCRFRCPYPQAPVYLPRLCYQYPAAQALPCFLLPLLHLFRLGFLYCPCFPTPPLKPPRSAPLLVSPYSRLRRPFHRPRFFLLRGCLSFQFPTLFRLPHLFPLLWQRADYPLCSPMRPSAKIPLLPR